MRRKILALLMAMAVSVTTLAGCGNNAQQSSQSSESISTVESNTSSETASSSEQEKVMEFEYFLASGSQYPESSPVWDLLMENTGVDIEFTWAADDALQTLLSSRIADHNLPDVIGNVKYNTQIQDMIDEGLIIPLTDLLEEKLPNYYRYLTEEDLVYAANASDGELYGLGYLQGLEVQNSWAVRQDWLDELGLEEPKTWDAWLNAWRKMKEADFNGNGKADEIPLWFDEVGMLNIFGIKASGNYCVEGDEYLYVAEHPRYMDFLDTTRMLYEEGIIAQDYVTIGKLADACASVGVGTFTASVSTAPQQTRVLREVDENAFYKCVSPVQGPFGDQLIPRRNKITNNTWITTAAVEEGKLDAILEFFDYLFSDEGIFITNYGIEGESYKVVDGKPVIQSPYVDNFKGARGYGIVPSIFPIYLDADVFNTISNAGIAEEDMDEITYEAVRGNTIVNQGYTYAKPQVIVTEATVEYAELFDQQKAIRDKYIMGMITKDEYLKEYDALKAAGLNEVIEQINEVYQTLIGK